ncbi:hypothetical protein BGZ65_003392, partial [Modicella reniformis]
MAILIAGASNLLLPVRETLPPFTRQMSSTLLQQHQSTITGFKLTPPTSMPMQWEHLRQDG